MNKFLKDAIDKMGIKEKIDLLMQIHEREIVATLTGEREREFPKYRKYNDNNKPWEKRTEPNKEKEKDKEVSPSKDDKNQIIP